MKPIRKYMLLLILAYAVVGCAPAAVVTKERYFWPPPPDQPRIEWLQAYKSQLDLETTSSRRIKSFFLGEDTPNLIKKPVEVRSDVLTDKVYVADTELGGVYVFDLLKKETRMLSMYGTGLPDYIAPIGMALDKDSNLYVLEPRQRKIIVFNKSEQYVRTIDLKDLTQRPISLAIDKNRGRLYVSDVKINKIFALDLTGVQLFAFGGLGEEEGSFNRPVSVAISSNGDIVVADSFNARIQVFKESGVFRRSFGMRGDAAGNFQLIKSVAVDPDDNIYVVDGRSHTVNIFNQSGELLLVMGGFYAVSTSGKTSPGGFSLPTGIDIDSRGRIYVADQINARIQVFQYMPDTATQSVAPTSRQVK